MGRTLSNGCLVSTPQIHNRWLTQQEAADLCGLSVRTIRTYIATGVLPAYRRNGGRNIRIRNADLDALFMKIPTVSDWHGDRK